MTETSLTDSIIKKVKLFMLIAFIIFAVFLAACGVYFFTCLSPKDSNNSETITFVLDNGLGVNQVADKLEDAGLIRSALVFKIYYKLSDFGGFQAGTYNLSMDMSVDDIINSFTTGLNVIENNVSITFVEGKRFPYYINKIADNFDYTYDEIMAIVTSKEFLENVIDNYWFIDDAILNEDLYYPLEGYLFPDTYEFKSDASIEDIINKMLTEMQNKLDSYKDEINLSGKKVSSLLTLASMVELEAVKAEHRLTVAGVFNNRLKSGMTLGSDVTTYYAAKKEMTESLTRSDLNACNAYNTRGTCVSGLPIGPICSPSLSSIVAAITPDETDYYYFVADVNNEVYFSKTSAEQDAVISKLRKQGLWPE